MTTLLKWEQSGFLSGCKNKELLSTVLEYGKTYVDANPESIKNINLFLPILVRIFRDLEEMPEYKIIVRSVYTSLTNIDEIKISEGIQEDWEYNICTTIANIEKSKIEKFSIYS